MKTDNVHNALLAEVTAELNKERREKAKVALKAKMKDRERAAAIVANLDREIQDLLASIDDGSFVG